MVLPALEHHLTKISQKNRKRLIFIGLCFSILACAADFISKKKNRFFIENYIFQHLLQTIGFILQKYCNFMYHQMARLHLTMETLK